MEDSEKAELGTKTIVDFFQQFGDDVYARILLEELFKGLINEEALFVFGEPLERRDQTGDGSSESIGDHIPTDGFDDFGSTDGMAASDLPDYP